MKTKEAYTTQEMSSLLRTAIKNVLRRAEREFWQSRPRAGRGGGKEWLVASMPQETRLALMRAIPDEEAPCPAVAPLLNTTPLRNLSEKDRQTVMARLAFVREIHRLALVGTRGAAISSLVLASLDGTLPPRLAGLIPQANARYGTGVRRGLSRRRLYGWCAAYDERGEEGLIPRNPQKVMTPPAWLRLFLSFWQRPQKPSVAHAYDDFTKACAGILARAASGLPVGLDLTDGQRLALEIAEELRAGVPSVHAVRRWIDKIALPEREAGRRTGNALLALRPHKLRVTKDLLPTDVYTADGTTADAEVLHPYHGQPFKPELTFVIDVATSYCVGVSVALAEDKFTILDALRMACLAGGIPAIFYTDNGPGYENRLMTAEGAGMLDRLGIDCARSIPGRPRGKGKMERAVKTITERLCKSFASCTHADMDGDAGHKVYKLTRAHIKKTGTTSLMPTWREFLEALKRRVAEYNAAPHRGLPLLTDADGKRRHYSPEEYWRYFVGQGWEPVTVPESLQDELFMPSERRQVRNGMVRFYNASYFSADLADWHGEVVEVRYDIWDPAKVYVWTLEGRRICAAELDGNAIPYFPASRVEAARAKRGRARVTRLEKRIQAITPGASVALPESDNSVTIDIADSLARDGAPVARRETSEPREALRDAYAGEAGPDMETALPDGLRRPVFSCATDRYEWLMRHQEQWTEKDRDWLERYAASEEYEDFRPIYEQRGLGWTGFAKGMEPCVSNL